MVNADLFEAYLNMSLPKDIFFINSLKLPVNDSDSIDDLVAYSVIKKQVSGFSSNKDLMSLYLDNPLSSIESAILEKDVSLRDDFDSTLLKYKESNSYSGDHKRKLFEVQDKLEYFSLVHSFTGSNINFNSFKKQMYTDVYNKVHPNKEHIPYTLPPKQSMITVGGLLVGLSLFAGSYFFPKEKEIITTIDSSFYESSTPTPREKLNQFIVDRNYLSRFESEIFQDVVDKNISRGK